MVEVDSKDVAELFRSVEGMGAGVGVPLGSGQAPGT